MRADMFGAKVEGHDCTDQALLVAAWRGLEVRGSSRRTKTTVLPNDVMMVMNWASIFWRMNWFGGARNFLSLIVLS